ncbi:MAG: hypothetical protein ACRDV7_14080 [Acidimicrobiia bacterium]
MRRATWRQDGFTTVQYVATVGLSLVFVVLFANLLVDLYARGAVRDALDEGVRAAAPVGTDASLCEQRSKEVLDGLLRGRLGDDIRVSCREDGAAMVARGEGTLPSWLPAIVPSWRVSLEARMQREP